MPSGIYRCINRLSLYSAHPLISYVAHAAKLKMILFYILLYFFHLFETNFTSSVRSPLKRLLEDLYFLSCAIRAHCSQTTLTLVLFFHKSKLFTTEYTLFLDSSLDACIVLLKVHAILLFLLLL